MKKGILITFALILVVGAALVLTNCSSGSSNDQSANNNNDTVVTQNTNTTSGGVGVISTNGKTVAFVPTATGLLPVAVEQTTAAPALRSPSISKAGGVTTGFEIDSCSVDIVDKKVVCVGYSSSKVAVFDISNYMTTLDPASITETECDLNTSTYTVPTVSFSGGDCVNCGVATDPGDHRYVVSSGDGYRVMSYGSCRSTLYDIPVNENFSFDPDKNWILAPEYDFETFTKQDGTTYQANQLFKIVAINAGNIYTWDKHLNCTDLAPNDANCYWYTTDSISIDPRTKIAVLSEEGSYTMFFVDLSQASFDSHTLTFTAPYSVLEMQNVANSRYPGTSVEPLSHLVFMEEEGATGMAVLQAPTTSGSRGVFPSPAAWSYNSVTIPDNDVCDATPGDGSADYYWTNVLDPHGLAIFTSQINRKPYGLLVSDSKDCVAMVSLQDFLNAPKAAGTNSVDPSYDLIRNNVVKFVKISGTAAPAFKPVPARELKYIKK